MARPSRCRRVCEEPAFDRFAPCGRSAVEEVPLTVDEYEVIRLVDYEKKTHAQCAGQMGISRTTVTEIYEKARYKIADCLVNGKLLRIAGGNYQVCRGDAAGGQGCGRRCRWKQPENGLANVPTEELADRSCQVGPSANEPHETASPVRRPGLPEEQMETVNREEGVHIMRIAVTYEDGNVYQHFGHTSQMKLYDVENGKIVKEEVVDTAGNGHGALAGFLAGLGADMLICGGIGGGAREALAEAGIELYPGVSGDADTAVKAFLNGSLAYDPDTQCEHHEHEHGEGGCGHHHGEGGPHGEDGHCHGHSDCGHSQG